MLCEVCQENEATVHLTQIVDGHVKKMNMCETCAAKGGLEMKGSLSITDILLGLGGVKAAGRPAVERVCPRCHMRRADFKKTGRLGCQECYETFAAELAPMVQSIHHSSQHVGGIPAHEEQRVQKTAEIAALQQALDKAVAGENFEEAARLRDRIAACRAQAAAAPAAPKKGPAVGKGVP